MRIPTTTDPKTVAAIERTLAEWKRILKAGPKLKQP
jgi:hypothetical protein